MSYTVTNLKDELQGILHGTTLDSVTNVTGTINRAARQVISEVNFFELKRKAQIANGVFDDVYDYAAPSDLKMNKIIDIRRQVRRQPSDNFSQTFSEQFDLLKENNFFTLEYQNAVKVFRISKALTAPVTLNEFDSLTSNGTWAAGDDATNLAQDTVNYVSSSASLKFDLDGSTTDGYIENSTMTEVNLSEHENQSSLFAWVFLPDTSIVTSIALRWGSDSSNYWTQTATTANFGAFQTGWNLVRFDWNGATETGTGDSSAIDYMRVTINYDGTADTDFRVDKVTSNLATIFDVLYYTESMFQDSSTSAFKTDTDSDNDLILLESASRNGLIFKTAEIIAQQVQQQGGSIDIGYFSNEYERWKVNYKRNYKDETIKPQESYYRINRRV